MSPELIKGEVPDQRADIYSLGVTLFEMVNGRPPYEADSAMTLMMMHLNDPIPDLRSIRPDIPYDLISIIEKSLSKSRTERYQTAGEMHAALQTVLERVESGASLPATQFEQPPAGLGVTPYVSVGGTLVDTPQQSSSVQPPPPRLSKSETTPPPYSTPVFSAPVYTAPVTPTSSSMEAKPISSTSSVDKPVVAAPGSKKPVILAGGAVVLIAFLCLLTAVVGILAYNQFFGGTSQASTEPTSLATNAVVVVAANLTSTPTFTPTPTPTATLPPVQQILQPQAVLPRKLPRQHQQCASVSRPGLRISRLTIKIVTPSNMRHTVLWNSFRGCMCISSSTPSLLTRQGSRVQALGSCGVDRAPLRNIGSAIGLRAPPKCAFW